MTQTSEKRRDVVEEIYGTLCKIKNAVEEKHPERLWMVEPPFLYLDTINKAIEAGHPYMWYFFALPQEIFRAFDVAALSPEYVSGVWASLGKQAISRVDEYFDIGGAHVTDNLCGVNKFPVGLILSGDRKPDLAVFGASDPCDAARGVYSNMNFCYDIPAFYIDVPYLSNERGYKYVANELRRMITFLETQTGQKLDWDRLREIIGYSTEAYETLKRLDNLRKNVPSPISSREVYAAGTAMMGLAGTPQMVDWLERRYKIAKEKAARKEGALKTEKYRLIWVANHIEMDLGIFDWLESKYNAVTVATLLGRFPFDPIDKTGSQSSILEGMAQRVLEFPITRQGRVPVDNFINEIISVAKDFKADGVVLAGNVGCKYYWASAQLTKDSVYDAIGIPTIPIELSPWDPRVSSPENIRAQFDQFFELMM
jgi:benzoyl-CoA reductase subunit B